MKVRLARDTSAPLWSLWWLDPPYALQWDRDGIPSSTYLAGYLRREDALAHAAREGWEVAP